MINTLEMSEYDTLIVKDYVLSADERTYLISLAQKDSSESKKNLFYFDELTYGLRIKSLSWVGVFELENVRIVIKPKFNKGFYSLIEMICFVENIPFYRWHDAKATMESSDLMELFVRLYLQELEKILRVGVIKEYIAEEDNLRHLRGRPDLLKNLRSNYSIPTRIYCRFDELVTNVIENQFIRAGIEVACRFKLHPKTLQKLNHYRYEFERVCECYQGEILPQFNYHRLNSHYKLAHKLTNYLFKQLAVNNIYQFQQQSYFSMLIDMNELFEIFIFTFLDRYLQKQYTVKHAKNITDAIISWEKCYRNIIPDILVTDKNNNNVKVIDTKYKNYGNKLVDNGDIYQLAFYAQYFHQDKGKAYNSIIIYPEYNKNTSDDIRIDLLPKTIHNGYIDVRKVSIEQILLYLQQDNKQLLKEKALQLIS